MSRPAHDPARFADHLQWLVGQLSAREGWLAMLADRRPAQLQAYLAGLETPPWDVIELLLTDYEQFRGTATVLRERTWALYTDVQRSAAARRRPAPPSWQAHEQDPPGGLSPQQAPSATALTADGQPMVAEQTPEEPAEEATRHAPPPQPRHRTAGAFLAALALGAAAPAPPPDSPDREGIPLPATDPHPRLLAQARTTARHLRALRAAGASGQAHAVLCHAATAPHALPALAAALEEDGQEAEIATLLWEVASLPADDLARAVQALEDGKRRAQAEQLARLAAGRPPGDIAGLARALLESGHRALAGHLLRSVVATRPRQDAVTVVTARPELAAEALAAAQAVSAMHRKDLLYALRAAGMTGVS